MKNLIVLFCASLLLASCGKGVTVTQEAADREETAASRETASYLKADGSEAFAIECVELLLKTKLPTYGDYEAELNFDTIDAPLREKEAFGDELKFTKQDNLYCAEIFLRGISDRLLAMMQIEGSGRFPHLTIYRFDGERKVWRTFFKNDVFSSEVGLVFPMTVGGLTRFVEEETNFDNRRLLGYRVLELEDGTWKETASVRARYAYHLTDEEKQWISEEQIEKIAAFDYSDMGFADDHPSEIELDAGKTHVSAKLWLTSVGYMASNYTITLSKNGTEIDGILKEAQWGFHIAERGGRHYLVCIGMGDDGHHRVSTIEDFLLTVLDLETLEVVHKSYITCEIFLGDTKIKG